MGTSTDLHTEAFDIVHRWWRAWVDNDTDAVENMLTHDYVERADTGALKVFSPQGLSREACRHRGDFTVTSWELSDALVKQLEHVIVCSYTFRLSGHQGRRHFTYEGRATDVLTQDGGRWSLVAHDGLLQRSHQHDAHEQPRD